MLKHRLKIQFNYFTIMGKLTIENRTPDFITINFKYFITFVAEG